MTGTSSLEIPLAGWRRIRSTYVAQYPSLSIPLLSGRESE